MAYISQKFEFFVWPEKHLTGIPLFWPSKEAIYPAYSFQGFLSYFKLTSHMNYFNYR